jgi:hypothetical protein
MHGFQELFDLGALAVVDVVEEIVMSRQGYAAPALTVKGVAGGEQYTYDRGLMKYRDPVVSVSPVGPKGNFHGTRNNAWNNANDSTRGCASRESTSLLVRENPTPLPTHILKDPPSNTAFLIKNISGSSYLGTGQNAGTSSTLNMCISFFLRKLDGSVITTSDVIVWCGNASSDWTTNRAGATQIQHVVNGWYRVWAIVPFNGASTTVQQGFKMAPNTAFFVEMPQHERTNSSNVPSEPIRTLDNTDRTREQRVLEVFLRGGTSNMKHLPHGALAVSFVPDYDYNQHEVSQLVGYGTTETSHALILSETSQRLAFWTRNASSTVNFMTAERLGAYAKHTPIGACGMWGMRGSNGEYYLAVNGKKEDVVTSVVAVPSLTSARLLIGGRLDGSDVASAPAQGRIRAAAIFDNKPERAGCNLISKVMQELAEDFWPWS